jgi:Holliday junction resolvase RusA-like endonuclease
VSDELLRLFPNASADFLRKNGFANIPPTRPVPPRFDDSRPSAEELPLPLPLGGVQASNAISLVLPYPPSANTYWRSRVIVPKGPGKKPMSVTYVTNEAREYKEKVGLIAASIVKTPLLGNLKLHLRIYRPMRRGDLSNRIKVLEDTLIGVCYKDDDQITAIEAERYDDKENPRVEVTVSPL